MASYIGAPTTRLSHMGFKVSKDKFDVVAQWYAAALAPLKYEKVMEFPCAVGLGANKYPDFWITAADDAPSVGFLHIAFDADDNATVDAFHAAGLKAGGKDNGAPGIRTQYHPNYYGAFLLDPIGNNIEIVNHKGK